MTTPLYNLYIRVGEYRTSTPIEYWDDIEYKNDVILACFIKAYIEKLLDNGNPIEEPIELIYNNTDTDESRTMGYSLREIESLTEPR